MYEILAPEEGRQNLPSLSVRNYYLSLSLLLPYEHSGRVPINIDNLQRFSMDHSEALPAKPINGEPAPKSRRQIAYNMIGELNFAFGTVHMLSCVLADPKLFQEIQTIESFGDFGNKIQALIRHLLYLQMNDPGAKSIVFSAWADSLHSQFAIVFPKVLLIIFPKSWREL